MRSPKAPKPDYSEQKRKWLAPDSDAKMHQTPAIIDDSVHKRLKQLAADRNERLVLTAGKLIAFALDILDDKAPTPPAGQTPRAEPTPEGLLPKLTTAIIASRFPGETGSNRARQLAVVYAIADANNNGRKPTVTSIAQMFSAKPTSILKIVNPLDQRGVISRTQMTGKVKWLQIRPKAVAALNKAHLAETGELITIP